MWSNFYCGQFYCSQKKKVVKFICGQILENCGKLKCGQFKYGYKDHSVALNPYNLMWKI